MWWIFAVFIIIAISYWIICRPYKYWADKGVEQSSSIIFPLGENWRTVFRTHSFTEMISIIYNKFPDKRYCGYYQFTLPVMILRDPDLIKQITVKDFDHFVDHRTFIPEDADPLWGKNLVALTGQKWREMRNTLSPAFTSSKMKYMFTLMAQNGEQFVQHFLKKNEETITLDMKDAFTRFTNDVIANTAFGVECDSLDDQNNEFFMMGKEATTFNFWLNFKFLGYFLAPWLMRLFKVSFFSDNLRNFFVRLIKTNVESREKFGIVRPDMINLLLEMRKSGLKYEENPTVVDTGFATAQESDIDKSQKAVKRQITDMDITAQALIFFFAGFDSVSTALCFTSHELALNPDVQDKLIQEIDEAMEACNGKLTYETLLGMKYLDMVVCEGLRKWPIAFSTDRIVTKPYTIEPKFPGEKMVHLAKNDALILPIFALHRDPNYFPDPDNFDPERFSDENKHKIKPYTYLPFGSGPRNCIGSRFALLEIKALLFYILAHFKIVPVEETKIPVIISKKHFNLTAEGGFTLGFKRRLK